MSDLPPPQDLYQYRSSQGPSRVAKIISGAGLVYMAASAVATALTFTAVGAADDYAKDASLKQAFDDAIRPANTFSQFAAFAELIIVISTFIWTYRVSKSVSNRGVLLRFTPTLCMLSWLLPPVLFVFPLIVLRDISSKTVHMRNDPNNRMQSLIMVWWALYGVIPLVMSFFGAAISSAIPKTDQELAKALSEQIVPNTISALSLIGAIFIWRQIVQSLSSELED